MTWAGGEMLTWVSGHFSAAHRDQETGEVHGHTWVVKAWFPNAHRSDARCFKAALDALLQTLDHTMLPDELAWAEDIAREIAILGCIEKVEVSRPHDGMGAEWKWAEKGELMRQSVGGFEDRFRVVRTDGKPVRAEARYLVLDYAGDPHAKIAVAAYADSIEAENPQMAADLRQAIETPDRFPAQHF